MPIGSTKPPAGLNSSDKSSTSASGAAAGGRTTFRPPWVKMDSVDTKPKTTIKTTAPWVKKTLPSVASEPSKDVPKKNGEAPAKTAPVSNKTIPIVASSKTPIKPAIETAAAPRKEAKLQSREIKVPIMTEKRTPVQEPLIKPKPKKPPTPSESEEEEDDDDDDEEEETESETESESEEEIPAPKQPETELERKFQTEKPKLRPVVVKRDKSLTNTQKKRDDDDDDEAEEGETEEDRERRRRFKLERPKLRHVVVNKQKSFNKSTDDFDKIRPVLKKVQKVDEAKQPPSETKPEFKDKVLKKVTPIKKEPSKPNVPAPPPLPSLVPKPPPPPPPTLAPPADFEKKELSDQQKATLEKLKTRPRKRPDWSEMMKEVESGKKLRHVECNDRSQPIITCKSMTKVDDKFVYETEKDNAHNKLLKQIQTGVKLKPVKTNDRSKPFLDGLRKFRRQMTIEEQIQKSESRAALNDMPPGTDEPSGDELDDIDKLRDDLQSTKQMLALELRNREAQERENKRLLAKIANLEAELRRDKTRSDKDIRSSIGADEGEDALIDSLKKDAEDARKISKELEKKYEKSAEQLDVAKNEIEEQKRNIALLEKKLAQALQGAGGSLNGSRRPSEANPNKESSPELELEMSESEEDEDEEKKLERKKRRLVKEVKILETKLVKLKDKQEAAKRERINLKQIIKKNHILLKEEKKKFKTLEKEVQKMAASMKDEEVEEDDEDDEAEEEDPEEQDQEAESEEESEESESEDSEGSGSETESESEPEDASDEAKKTNLEPRVKRHENRLSALKKGNVLLQANVDNLQDEISKVREKSSSLQAELDAVLADLGL